MALDKEPISVCLLRLVSMRYWRGVVFFRHTAHVSQLNITFSSSHDIGCVCDMKR
jgi:hypothetical protein